MNFRRVLFGKKANLLRSGNVEAAILGELSPDLEPTGKGKQRLGPVGNL